MTCRPPSVPHRDGAGLSVASSAKWAVVPRARLRSYLTQPRPSCSTFTVFRAPTTDDKSPDPDDVTDRTPRYIPSMLKHESEKSTNDARRRRRRRRRASGRFALFTVAAQCQPMRAPAPRGCVYEGRAWRVAHGRQRQQRCHDDALYPAIRIFSQVAACRAQSVRTGSRSDNARILLGYETDATRRETGRVDDDDDLLAAFTRTGDDGITVKTARTRVERGDRASELMSARRRRPSSLTVTTTACGTRNSGGQKVVGS